LCVTDPNAGIVVKRVGIFLLLIMTLWSCEEEVPEVSFRIETDGFFLEEAFLGTADAFTSFSHKVSGGVVTFSSNNTTYKFNTDRKGMEEYLFQLPVGEYQLTFTIPQASLYGQERGSFTVHSGKVIINEQTESISVHVEANCAMFLVYDELSQLDKGIFMIEKHSFAHGYFRSYPLFTDSLSGSYYAYFTPDTVPSDPSAFLWFYDGETGIEEGGLTTKDLEIGYQYNIKILDK
jgi:hypothetical protein